MHPYLKKALSLFLIIAIGAFVSRHYGWYTTYWFTDVILHIIAGCMFGYLWLWISKQSSFSERWIFALSLVSFAALGSVLWEFWEYYGHIVMPAKTQYYVPELGDTLSDIACGLLGAALLAMVKWRGWKSLKIK